MKLLLPNTIIFYVIHRYIGDIFFTSNEPLDKINQILDEANNFHPNIKLVRQIGTRASFLDLFIENKDGVLETLVYRKEATEPYIVPFKSDHPPHVFTNIINPLPPVGSFLTHSQRGCRKYTKQGIQKL